MFDPEPNNRHVTRTSKPKKKIGVRHYQYALLYVTFVVYLGIYTAMSVAIVKMTGEPTEAIPDQIEFQDSDTLLSAFFWIYFFPHIAGGKLSSFFGPKWFLFATMLVGSLLNLAIPAMLSYYGSSGVIGCRVIQGLCQGFLFPSINNLINAWTATVDRSRIVNIIYSGETLGIAISMPVAGVLTGTEGGWPNVFYVFGFLGLLWAAVFAKFVRNSPSVHPSIPEDEKMYLESNTSVILKEEKQLPTPWIPILKSIPVWAIVVSGCAQCWGRNTLLTQIPSYMSNVMGYDLSEDGDLSALPYIVMLVVSFIVVPVAAKLTKSRTLSKTTIRKIFNSLGSLLPAVALIALAFLDSSARDAATALLVIAVSTSVIAQSGYMVNVTDVAPDHAQVILGIVNTFTNVFSILGPLTVGFFGSDKTDPILWRKVFLLAFAIYVVCGVFYVYFASAEVQDWNYVDENESSTASKIKKLIQKTKLYQQLRRLVNRIKSSSFGIAVGNFFSSFWSTSQRWSVSLWRKVSCKSDSSDC